MTQLPENAHSVKSWLNDVQESINAQLSASPESLENKVHSDKRLGQGIKQVLDKNANLRDMVLRSFHSRGHQTCVMLLKTGYPDAFSEVFRLMQTTQGTASTPLEEDAAKLDILKDHFKLAEEAHKNGRYAQEYTVWVNLAAKIGETDDVWLSEQLLQDSLSVTSRLPYGELKAKVDILQKLSLLNEQQGNLEAALFQLEHAYAIAKGKAWKGQSSLYATRDREVAAQVHHLCMTLGCQLKNINIHSAITMYRRAYDIASEGYHRNMQTAALSELSRLYASVGEFSEALKLLGYFKRMCELKEDKENLCKILYCLADVYERQGNITEAESHLGAFQEAVQFFPEAAELRGALGILGRMNMHKGLFKEAETLFRKAYETAIEESMSSDSVVASANLEFCRVFYGIGKGNILLPRVVSLLLQNDNQTFQILNQWRICRKGLEDVESH